MAVRIRLKRLGKIHAPVYRVVVVDSRKKRDGRVIEEIGTYNPTPNPSHIVIDSDRAQYWLSVGAQPSDAVHRMLVLTGDIAKMHGKADAVSRVEIAETDRSAEAVEAIKKAEDTAEKSKAEVAAKKAAQKAEEEAKKAEEEAQKAAEKAQEAEAQAQDAAEEVQKTEEAEAPAEASAAEEGSEEA